MPGGVKSLMYLEYWGFDQSPFSNVPTQSLFYRSPQHEEALSRLVYVMEHRKGVAMLTGEVGCGKTTVARALMDYLDTENFQVLLLSNPALDPLDLIKAILLNFGETVENGSKSVLLDQLRARLIQNAEQGINTVLTIDEAHVIRNDATLDELRMLLNLQANNQFLITLVLVGQPPLLKRISDLQPLKERISVKFHLEPLDVYNTARYILYRLKSVGATRGLFTIESLKPLYEYSGGIPLRINNVCDRCLLIGFMQRSGIIGTRIVNDAIEDLK
jgi:type II secretory pathway predicted ATPase ExeA